jgi:hypothetical protein
VSDAGLPPPTGVAGAITAIAGLITAAGIAYGYVYERVHARVSARAPDDDKRIARIAKAVVLEELAAAPAKPAKKTTRARP